MSEQDELDLWRTGRRGRTFVYVLPCQGEDLTKVGFTHDPVQRLRTFYPRFFTLFDLDRGLLVETGRLAEARRMERLLIERWPAHRASAPLLVSAAAGGHTEWFRGIAEEAGTFAGRIAERYGYRVHAPLRDWLHQRFAERADALFEWSSRMLAMIEWQVLNLPPPAQDGRYAQALGDTLDACAAAGMDLAALLPAEVMAWQRRRC
ncbi:GIY-YIG nuclease family protein [Dyella acidiphila]|uniref:GIY-YIG nuclease family protein n=1 Tax=Dyella acidiphila TaxID=2775866 RepID=A0ABR9G717_9GAMM|nr:GIY-YIG nuclease family protein [Dyella acidiphila]MBE1159847.1 GIY-YIG nuclease family protein [Dyella acidiphila]